MVLEHGDIMPSHASVKISSFREGEETVLCVCFGFSLYVMWKFRAMESSPMSPHLLCVAAWTLVPINRNPDAN